MKLTITAKCSDCCFARLETDTGTMAETQGYVPRNFGIGGGDYIKIEVDLKTGKLIGFTPPDNETVKEFILENKIDGN